MLDPKGHVQQAQHNEQLVEFLDNTPYMDWRATCVFYAALHYVQAYFLSRTPIKHFVTHVDRDKAIESDPNLGGIWNDYRSLKDWSIQARYNAKKPSGTDFTNDIFKSLSSIKKTVGHYTAIA